MGRKAPHVKFQITMPDDIQSDTQNAKAQNDATRTKHAVP